MAIKTLDQFKAECRTELQAQRDGDGIWKQVNNVRSEIDDAEFEQMVVDCANGKLDAQDNGYIRARQEAYAAIGDQLDMLYHDMTSSKGDKSGDWYKAVKKVKDDNPKPS
mgnify:CR=1 FL=1